MTRLPRRASLLLAFSLLTSAAPAYAECAWMMARLGVESVAAMLVGPHLTSSLENLIAEVVDIPIDGA